ncbi:MAG: fructose-1,6-bisphosphatase [Clostridia bacterium]|nr:fructose-1,6-bisphosphatase [Clostridia bacterium]MBQ5725273.1 fructose-1,6-bisphosphatase [Clostridia bacterium]
MKQAYTKDQLKILNLLAAEYPSIAIASATLVNLNALSNLPKGTEHFMSDLHGEAAAFEHILNNCSGVIREKVDTVFYRTMSEEGRRTLCTLIYYPAEKLAELRVAGTVTDDWYRITLYRLVDLARSVASKYTREKVREALPHDFRHIIDELLHTSGEEHDKQAYYRNIITTVIEIGQAEAFICALCALIKRMAVDRLHVVGDIYDRGNHADRILDMLREHHRVDIQWGNHDIVWMGAAAGSEACVATVLNSALQYNTLSIVENTYGISLRDLIGFAQETYRDSTWFMPRNPDDAYYVKNSMDNLAKAHKAIAIILFKLEGQLIRRHPEYGMEDRLLLDDINYEDLTITIGGESYPLNDGHFPTIDPADPYALSPAEASLIKSLTDSFRHSRGLRRHIDFLYNDGSLYKICNGNLLFHGCVPMTQDGGFEAVTAFDGVTRSGRAYMDFCDKTARAAYYDGGQDALDFMYYLWCGRQSPLFGRERMTTFERYFVADRKTWEEPKNPYYELVEDYIHAAAILREFGLDPRESHIINGHVPVRAATGEHPVRAGGRYIRIDGGFCRAYHDKTGIAGYTLIYSSRGLRLVSHIPFEGKKAAVRENRDILAVDDVIFEMMPSRKLVRDTDEGRRILERMEDLRALLAAYREGVVLPAE